jgi:hypothetical protein
MKGMNNEKMKLPQGIWTPPWTHNHTELEGKVISTPLVFTCSNGKRISYTHWMSPKLSGYDRKDKISYLSRMKPQLSSPKLRTRLPEHSI